MRSIFARRAATQVACLGALTGALLACASPTFAAADPAGPEISVTPSSYDFGEHASGSFTDQAITVTNSGDLPLTLDGYGLEAPEDGADFDFGTDATGLSTCPEFDTPVAPHASCTIVVGFLPEGASRGLKQRDLIISSDAVDTPEMRVHLSGTVVDPAEISFDSSSLDFGDVEPGQASAVQNVTITNTGQAALTVREPRISSDDGYSDAAYSVAANTCTDHPVAHGDHCTIGVRFSPSWGGSMSANLKITSDATAENWASSTVALSGTATYTDPPVTPEPPVDPQPPVIAQPPVVVQPPVDPTDTDADGIHNDWVVNGKPVAAPAMPKLGKVTGKSVTVKLPKAPKGSKLTVYVGTGNGKFTKVTGKANKKGELTLKSLKKNTNYEVKLVKVNKAGKQSAASKTLKVKTAKK